ncbi:MAG: hypothetical protein WB626_12170 [Bacteroidota bacterium]
MSFRVRDSGLLLLALVYAAMGLGSACALLQPAYAGRGPASLTAPARPVKEIPRKVILPRRHHPLVKQTPVPEQYPEIPQPPGGTAKGEEIRVPSESIPVLFHSVGPASVRAPPSAVS